MLKSFLGNKNSKKNNNESGLTIVELLVVVSIFMIITGISIFNYNKFNSYTSTQNLADDIAMTIRQAQSYAIGVRGTDENSDGSNPFNVAYGVSFSLNPTPSHYYSPSSTSFILFADIDNDNLYDYNEGDTSCGLPKDGNECVDVLTIKSDDKMSEILLNKTVPVSGEDSIVNIIFKRPNPEPKFCYSDLGFNCNMNFSSIGIKVSSEKEPDTIYKTIEVSNVGQISVY